jgi:hypothetical protein
MLKEEGHNTGCVKLMNRLLQRTLIGFLNLKNIQFKENKLEKLRKDGSDFSASEQEYTRIA